MKRNGWRRPVWGMLAAAMVLAGAGIVAQSERLRKENNDYYESRIRQEKQWIMENSTPDGAILTYYTSAGEDGARGDTRYMNPYFACTAARGLLRGEATAQERRTVKAYLCWHADHLAPDGSIFDYDYLPGTAGPRWQSRKTADSVDSYAALYLILAAEYYHFTGDAAFLQEQSGAIAAAADRLLKLQQANGLMTVSDRNLTCYTMDNAEVNLALKMTAELAREVPPLAELLPRVEEALVRNTAAINSLLWDKENEEYAVGLDAQGNALKASDREKIYPYWSAQIFPQLFACEEADSGGYDKLCRSVAWTSLGFRGDSSSSYWCALLCSAAQNKDKERVRAYLAAYDSALGEGRAYPYYCAESGWAILAFDLMKY